MKNSFPKTFALRFRHLCAAFVLASAGQTALAAGFSTEFTLSGYLTSPTPLTFDLTALENYASANPTAQRSVTVGADVWSGISLNSFLSSYVKTDASVPKNDFLRDYVTAQGSDSYQAAFSFGEINPNFGNQNDIIAYQLNGQNLTTSGFARIIVPGDVQRGRWVSNLTDLQIGHVPYTPGPGGVSTEFTFGGDVTTPLTYTSADLPGSLTVSTVTVPPSTSPPSLANTVFTGVSLLDLLNQSTIIVDTNIKNDILRKIVIATGTDGYDIVFSMGELLNKFGNQPDYLAYQNAPGSPLGLDGFARTVALNDLKGGRYVSNLNGLTVIDASIPEPSTLLLMAVGMFGFRRRKPSLQASCR